MPQLRFSPRLRGAALALALFASLLSCGREVTGPGGRGALVGLQFAPDYTAMIDQAGELAHAVSDLVPFTRVRIELRRVDNTVAASQIINFPADATEIPLTLNVRLGAAAQDGAEPMTAFLRYINAAGDTVFAGQVAVTAQVQRRGEQPTPVQVPIAPTVPGAVFARIDIAPDTTSAVSGSQVNFTATGYDGQDNVVPNAIIGYISRNPALAVVPSVGSGTVNLIGVRGFTWIVAQSLTGVKDSAFLVVLPRPASIVKVSGDAQTALTGEAFAEPLRVRLLAADGLPVRGWPVNFAATSGGGLVSSSIVATDTAGYAQVTWTAGAAPGAATVTASVSSPALSTTFTGTQASTLPTSLAFLTQPTAITSGIALPSIQVAVRNGAGQTIPDFTGAVTLGLTGGTAGAALVGTSTVNAVAGVATFTNITVNKGGTNYRLTATFELLPPAQSNTFNAAAAPATTITLLGGGGQVAPPSTQLPDSIRVRLTDTFGFPVVGATLQFTVAQGGGLVSEASRVTDADGRAGVLWTLGASGAQQLRVSLGALETFVSAGIIAGGDVSLFAGFDYTLVRAGGSKLIPLYLTNPSASPIEVTLSVDDSSGTKMAWASSTVNIPPGNTRLDVALNGLSEGTGWAIMRSSFGDDSVLVTVDSSGLAILDVNQYNFVEGDTIRTFVKLDEPAPAGGVTVILRSVNPSLAILAPSSGAGHPEPGCIDGFCGGGSVMALREEASPVPTSDPSRLLATPADTAAVFIPEGQVFGEFAIVFLDDLGGCASVQITAEATGFVGDDAYYVVQPQDVFIYTDYANPPTSGVGIGQQTQLDVYVGIRRLKPTAVYFQSSDPTRVVLDTIAYVAPGDNYTPPVRATVVGADSAWVRYWAMGSTVDSLLIIGKPAKLEIDTYSFIAEGGLREVTVRLTGRDNPWSNYRSPVPVPITVTSSNPAVLAVEQVIQTVAAGEASGLLRVRTVGSGMADMIVSAPGYDGDTLTITSYVPSVYVSGVGSGVGAGQLADLFIELEYDAVAATPRTVNVQSLAPAVLEVLTPSVTIGSGSTGAYVRLRGVAPGGATLRFTGPGLADYDVFVPVDVTQMLLSIGSEYAPDNVERPLFAYLYGAGNARPMADTTYAVLRSTDSTVVAVVDSMVTFPAGGYNGIGGSFRAVGPGNAVLWLVRPGRDSVLQSVTVRPYSIVPQFLSVVAGRQLEEPFTLYREGPDTVAAAITINQSGPGSVSFRTPITEFPVGEFSVQSQWVGETPGQVTLTITVAGYPPVEQVVFVENTSLALNSSELNPAVGGVDEYVYNEFAVTGNPGNIIAGKPLTFVMKSLDTTLAVVEQDTIRWMPGDQYFPSQYASVRYKRVGNVSLAVTDADGVLPGDTIVTYIYPAELTGWAGSGFSSSTIGMNQRLYDDEAYVSRMATAPEPLTVYLTSSNPSVVQVPATVVIPAGEFSTYFSYSAGDTTGSARVTASAPGYNPWEFDVLVTRSKFGVWSSDLFTDGGAPMEVYVVDAMTENVRPLNAPVNVRLSTLTPNVIDTVGATFTMPADSGYVYRRAPRGLVPGWGTFALVDNGPARFDSVLATWSTEEIVQARVLASQRRILLTPGLVSDNFQTDVNVRSGRDTVWLRMEALRSSFVSEDDSIRVVLFDPNDYYDMRAALSENLRMQLRPLDPGPDSLVLSATGMAPDTVLVLYGEGMLRTTGTIPNIVVGDSIAIPLQLFDAAGGEATAAESLSFDVFADTTFTVRSGGLAASSVSVSTGLGALVIWVRAEQAGSGSVSITHPDFRTLTLNLTAVPRP